MVFEQLDDAVLIGEGQGTDEDVIDHRERGCRGADPERGDNDRGERESGRARKGAGSVLQILARDVEVDAGGVIKDFEDRRDVRKARFAEFLRMNRAEFFAVFIAKRGGLEMQQRPVESHVRLSRV
jgi:hypothetical protein